MRQKRKATAPISRSGDKSFSTRLPSKGSLILCKADSSLGFSPANYRPVHPLGAAVFSEQAWREIARSLKLSGRELQILRDVFDDYTEFTIAANLKVSPHTIHTHCERLYRKLAVTDRVKLVLRVIYEFLALTLAPGSVLPPICANRAAGHCPLHRG